MNLSEQVNKAIQNVKDMFKDSDPVPPIPAGATLESLWAKIQELEKKRIVHKPGVEDAVKMLLEDPQLAEIPIPMIAEIIREVFSAYGVKCKCSESSVRWYQSQRNLEWNIIRRRMPKVEVVKDVIEPRPEGT